ncbi:hypothetical protein LX36DRAFT_487487 [Colletotrichum falcatum]|nr:hypothetical protein LX36DRAFT_487487 [Colletotrichum falcatum]
MCSTGQPMSVPKLCLGKAVLEPYSTTSAASHSSMRAGQQTTDCPRHGKGQAAAPTRSHHLPLVIPSPICKLDIYALPCLLLRSLPSTLPFCPRKRERERQRQTGPKNEGGKKKKRPHAHTHTHTHTHTCSRIHTLSLFAHIPSVLRTQTALLLTSSSSSLPFSTAAVALHHCCCWARRYRADFWDSSHTPMTRPSPGSGPSLLLFLIR